MCQEKWTPCSQDRNQCQEIGMSESFWETPQNHSQNWRGSKKKKEKGQSWSFSLKVWWEVENNNRKMWSHGPWGWRETYWGPELSFYSWGNCSPEPWNHSQHCVFPLGSSREGEGRQRVWLFVPWLWISSLKYFDAERKREHQETSKVKDSLICTH